MFALLALGRWSLSRVSPQARSHPRDAGFLGVECSSSEEFEGQARWGPRQVWISVQICRCSMFWSINKHDPTDTLLTLILCEDGHTPLPPPRIAQKPHTQHTSLPATHPGFPTSPDATIIWCQSSKSVTELESNSEENSDTISLVRIFVYSLEKPWLNERSGEATAHHDLRVPVGKRTGRIGIDRVLTVSQSTSKCVLNLGKEDRRSFSSLGNYRTLSILAIDWENRYCCFHDLTHILFAVFYDQRIHHLPSA